MKLWPGINVKITNTRVVWTGQLSANVLQLYKAVSDPDADIIVSQKMTTFKLVS